MRGFRLALLKETFEESLHKTTVSISLLITPCLITQLAETMEFTQKECLEE
jgi:hypothetical protein